MFKFLTWRPDTTPDQPAPAVLARFRTRGGAEVHLTAAPTGHTVHCHGCDYQDTRRSRTRARGNANAHADYCRSMTKPTPQPR